MPDKEFENAIAECCDKMNNQMNIDCIHFLLYTSEYMYNILHQDAGNGVFTINKYIFNIVIDPQLVDLVDNEAHTGDIWVRFNEDPK